MNSINSVKLTKLKNIENSAGDIHKLLNSSEEDFKGFGEIYTSEVKVNSIKAWKLHKFNDLNLVVIKGKVKFVFYDKTSFREIITCENKLERIFVPAKIWFGFKCLSNSTSLILSLSNEVHSEDEVLRKELKSITYCW